MNNYYNITSNLSNGVMFKQYHYHQINNSFWSSHNP